MSHLINLTGQRFNHLLVVRRAGTDQTGKTTWLCQCDCGGTSVTTGLNLKSGNSKSCGCRKHLSGLDNPRTIRDPQRLLERKRALSTVRTWRAKVIRRNPVCLKCGTQTNLQAHHIHGFADAPHLRIDPQNGATLCGQCHTNFHLSYGRRTGFTEANLNEWLVGISEPAPVLCIGTLLDGDACDIVETVTHWRKQGGLSELRRALVQIDRLIAENK